MNASHPARPLDAGLPRYTPINIEIGNILATRIVRLGELLGTPELMQVRVRTLRRPPPSSTHLVIAGRHEVLARIALPDAWIARQWQMTTTALPPRVQDAIAAQLLWPSMAALRALFDDELIVRLEYTEESWPWRKDALELELSIDGDAATLACCVHEKLSPRIRDVARRLCARIPLRRTEVPMFAGHQIRVALSQVRALQVGDFLLCDEPERHDDGHLSVFAQATLGDASPSRFFAVVLFEGGRITHITPGHRTNTAESDVLGPVVTIDIVLGRFTTPSLECRSLALRQRLEAHGAARKRQLQIGGKVVGTVRETRLGRRRCYEVVSLSGQA